MDGYRYTNIKVIPAAFARHLGDESLRRLSSPEMQLRNYCENVNRHMSDERYYNLNKNTQWCYYYNSRVRLLQWQGCYYENNSKWCYYDNNIQGKLIQKKL